MHVTQLQCQDILPQLPQAADPQPGVCGSAGGPEAKDIRKSFLQLRVDEIVLGIPLAVFTLLVIIAGISDRHCAEGNRLHEGAQEPRFLLHLLGRLGMLPWREAPECDIGSAGDIQSAWARWGNGGSRTKVFGRYLLYTLCCPSF